MSPNCVSNIDRFAPESEEDFKARTYSNRKDYDTSVREEQELLAEFDTEQTEAS